jgi:hypothetical protein
MPNVERPAQAEADSKLLLIVLPSASIAPNRLLRAGLLLLFASQKLFRELSARN